jgi:hypothetical protein
MKVIRPGKPPVIPLTAEATCGCCEAVLEYERNDIRTESDGREAPRWILGRMKLKTYYIRCLECGREIAVHPPAGMMGGV